MDIGKTVVFGALVPLMLACGHSALAQTQGSQTQTTGPQAAPSQAPASQATEAVTGPKGFSPSTEVGTEQAAPSQRPAPQATASAMEKRNATSQ
jgi:hypothetical protein